MTKDEILIAIQKVVAHAGGDWPDKAGEPEVLRRVKMVARIAASHPKAAPKAAPGEPAASAAKGAIMGAAYDFRDAHISGSMNLKRSAHAALEDAVDNALAAQAAPPPAPAPLSGDDVKAQEILGKLEKLAHWEDERDMGPGGRWWVSIPVASGKPSFRAALAAQRGK